MRRFFLTSWKTHGKMKLGGISMSSPMFDLNARRKALKMPVDLLVQRSGVARPTVFRILRGKAESVRFGYVQKVADALGYSLGGPSIDPEELRRREAKRKARLLSRLTQGTMGLESQAVSAKLLEELEEEAVAKLLAGKGRKLWSL
jgi:transcriptional regulator with XRE-family HTH domain